MGDSKPANGVTDRFPELERLGDGARKRRIPYVAQMMATDCGAACLTMVLAILAAMALIAALAYRTATA